MRSLFAIFLAAAATFACADERAPSPVPAEPSLPFAIHGNAAIEYDSAYVSYGKVGNEEPLIAIRGRLDASTSDFGYLGAGYVSWDDLTHHRDAKLSRGFHRWDPEIHYGYKWKLSDDFSFDQEVLHVWYIYKHYRNRDPKTSFKFQYKAQLTNPWVTPFMRWVYQYRPWHGSYFETGLKRTFKFGDRFSVEALAKVDFDSGRYMEAFYPATVAGRRVDYDAGIVSAQAYIAPKYKLTDNLVLYAKVAYISVINETLRGNVKDFGSADARDLVWYNVGMQFTF